MDKRLTLAVVFTLATAVAVSDSSIVWGEDGKLPPQSFGIRKTNIPELVARGEAAAYVNQVVAISKQSVAQGAFLQKNADDKRTYVMRYPGLRYRDIVPAFEGVYIVTGVSDVGQTPYVSFARLPFEGVEVPEKASVGKGTYPFVFGVGGGGEMHLAAFDAQYVPTTTKGPERVQIRCREQLNEAGSSVLPPTMPHSQVAGVGDEVRIGDSMHKIVNIVAPNDKTKVVGWFELSKQAKDAPPAE